MRRLLIMACGSTKRIDAGLLPAMYRYHGSPYQTVRKALREVSADHRPTVLILSAAFGLIAAETPIPVYDRRMTASRAVELRAQVRVALAQAIQCGGYAATLINLGADYMPALDIDPAVRSQMGRITYASGGIGERMHQMKHWIIMD